MSETTHESRRISTLRTETKIAVILGLGLIGVAAYFYFTSVYLLKPEGGIFACGSPSSPNTESKNICGAPEGVSRARALTALGIGLMTIVLGFALFGLGDARHNAPEVEFEDDLDEDEDEDNPRSGAPVASDRYGARGQAGGSTRRDLDSRRSGSGRSPRGSDEDIEGEAHHDKDDAVGETRSGRRSTGTRRSVLRDDDFGESSPRRRKDDDWDSDGWR